MFKKIALLMLTISFLSLSGLKPKAALTAKKYTFVLVQEAERKFEEKIKTLNLIIKSLEEKLKQFEVEINKDGSTDLSDDDKDKLKYLLSQVLSYR